MLEIRCKLWQSIQVSLSKRNFLSLSLIYISIVVISRRIYYTQSFPKPGNDANACSLVLVREAWVIEYLKLLIFASANFGLLFPPTDILKISVSLGRVWISQPGLSRHRIQFESGKLTSLSLSNSCLESGRRPARMQVASIILFMKAMVCLIACILRGGHLPLW